MISYKPHERISYMKKKFTRGLLIISGKRNYRWFFKKILFSMLFSVSIFVFCSTKSVHLFKN